MCLLIAGWLINNISLALEKLRQDATSINISCLTESILQVKNILKITSIIQYNVEI